MKNENTAHLIESIKVYETGETIELNIYCKDDREFRETVDELMRRYGSAYVKANHHTEKKGNKALNKAGDWVVIKKNETYCKVGRAMYDEKGRKVTREYMFSSIELAKRVAREFNCELNGRIMKARFEVGGGISDVLYTYKKVRLAY